MDRPATHVQKLLFDAKEWTPVSIRAWIASQPASYRFTARKIELIRDDYHVRQQDPDSFVKSSFRTIPFGDLKRTGIQAVVGHLAAESGHKFRVVYLGAGARRAYYGDPLASLPVARKEMRRLKSRGLTPWIETDSGAFVPVPGARRKPAEHQ